MSILSNAAIIAARKEVGQHEEGGNNRGPAIARYLKTVGLEPPQPWCAAFVCTAIADGSKACGVPKAVKFSASAVRLWEKNPTLQIQGGKDADAADIEESIFCIAHPPKNGTRPGHTGFVLSVDADDPNLLHTVEGNTASNLEGEKSREGDSVCFRTRERSEITLGFLRIE